MARACLIISALFIIASLIPTGLAQLPLETELIIDGDFEAADLSAWTPSTGSTSHFVISSYGLADTPSTAIAAQIGGATALARAVSNHSNGIFLEQSFDLSGNAAAVDAGTLGVRLGANLGGHSSDEDRTEVYARFYNDVGGELTTPFVASGIGYLSATNRNFETTMQTREGLFPIPPGTRTLDIEVRFYRLTGVAANGYVDNVSAQITANLSTPALPLDTELLDNGDLEAPSLINPALGSSWTVTSGYFYLAQYGGSELPLFTVSADIGGGNQLVRGGYNHSSPAVAVQQFDVSGNAFAIDTNALSVKISGHFGGFSTDEDRAELYARFYNDSGGELTTPFVTSAIGYVSAGNRNFETTLLRKGGEFPIPAGTRRLDVELRIYRLAGTVSHGYADEFSAMLTTTALPPATPVGVELIDNGDFENGLIVNPSNPQGWFGTGTGQLVAAPYGAPGLPLPGVSNTIGGGTYLLTSLWNNAGQYSMKQTFDLRGDGADIDAGNRGAHVEAHLGGLANDIDYAYVLLSYLTQFGGVIAQDSVGPVYQADRGNLTTLLFRQGDFTIPFGTRFLDYEIVLVRASGVALDATADNLHLSLTDTTQVLLYPGSDEDLRLKSGINSLPSTGPGADLKTASAGDVWNVSIDSPLGTNDFLLFYLLGNHFPTGFPPASPFGFPEVHFDPMDPGFFPIVDAGAPNPFFGSPVILPQGNHYQFWIPTGAAGVSVIIQAIALNPNTANAWFAASEAHELQILP